MIKFNTCVGQVAQGDHYFPRPAITEQIWEKLKTGHNILLAAPRRVGKTSIMNNLKDNPLPGFIVLYEIPESVNNEKDYYKRLFKSVIQNLHGLPKAKAKVREMLRKFPFVKKISTDGIELEKTEISYFEEFKKLCREIILEDEKIIMMIDEFPATVENIIRDEGKNSAIKFLETNRELRQTPEIKKNIQFIYAGSIGLENLVARMEAPKLINDILPIKINPLNKIEAHELINKILSGSEALLVDDVIDYILQKIEWYIPFYFQLIMDEVEKILRENDSTGINKNMIDKAMYNALELRSYFEHWLTRLRQVLQGHDYSFAISLLSNISENGIIESNEIIDLAIKYNIRDTYRNLLNILVYDGYINNHENAKIYRFNSPLLKMWWKKNVAE